MFNTDEIQDRKVALLGHLDEQIDVAVGPVVAARAGCVTPSASS
jgi:hypothetical protein